MAGLHLPLEEYPFVVVRFACTRCDRQGSLNKSKLIGEHGAGTAMFDLRQTIAGCKLRSGKPCGVFYPDLVEG